MSKEEYHLLMEALMFFSSDESDDTSSRAHDSEHETQCPTTMSCASRQDNNTVGHVDPRISGDATPAAQTNQPTNSIADNRAAPAVTPASKQPLRRKRVKKCTYAARREEVARLRGLTFQLEAQLVHLQKCLRSSDMGRQRAQYEMELLAQSQAENERLRMLLSLGESRIKQAQVHQYDIEYPEQQSVV